MTLCSLVFQKKSFKPTKKIGSTLIRDEIVKIMLDIFAKAAKNPEAKNVLAQTFLHDLCDIIKTYFQTKPIVKNGMVNLLETSSDLLRQYNCS